MVVEKEPRISPKTRRILEEKCRIEIPKEGLEPGERPEEAQPKILEYSGVTWAISTAEGWCRRFAGEDERVFEQCLCKLTPKLLEKRGKWERNTWEGIKEFIGIVEEMMEDNEDGIFLTIYKRAKKLRQRVKSARETISSIRGEEE